MSTHPQVGDVPWREDGVPALLRKHLPQLDGSPVSFLGSGWDNACYLVEDVVVRVGALPLEEARDCVETEARVLGLASSHLSCAVPVPLFVDLDAAAMAYRLVPGHGLAPGAPAPWGTALGTDLARLHAIPLDAALAATTRKDRSPSAQLADAAHGYAACASQLPEEVRAVVEPFLAAPPPPATTREALCHNDLAAEHVIVDEAGALVGIIDWTDARVTDPMADFGGLYRDAGPQVAAAVLDAYRAAGGAAEQPDVERVRFSARCAVVLDLEYAVRTGRRRYWDEALRVLPHTFA